jgi:hypothetical protein
LLSPRLVAIRRAVLLGWVLVLAGAWVVDAGAGVAARLGLFVATLVVEVAAVATALAGRGALTPEDPGRAALSAIALGLSLRTIAEVRLLLMYLEAVPSFIRDDATLWPLFFYGLRYLYAAADVALLVGLVRTLRGLRSTGLGFKLRRRDGLVLALLVPLPLVVYVLQAVVQTGPVDPNIFLFRVIGTTVGAVVTGVCVALASAALQMGGGAWPWIWGAAATAGIARAFAFVAAAAAPAVPYAGLIEQSLLWTFACGWLLAVALHRRLLTGG